MKPDRLKRIIQLCRQYQEERIAALEKGIDMDKHFDSLKKYIALEVIDAYKSGELKEDCPSMDNKHPCL